MAELMMTLQQAHDWLPGARWVGDASVAVSRVHSDTRSLEPGDLFVALKGERFDGNDFLTQAKAQGAVAALCQGDTEPALASAGLPGLVVPDSKKALGQLAAAWRAQFKLPLIAVTGSNGKTTVTQMVASILHSYKPQAMLATQGNLNNDIGVPLTLLRLRRHHQIAVVELGMNHPGEIAALAAMAQPTVALVNNAQREHLEFMATIEAVAKENGAVIAALNAPGVAVFPADDDYTALWAILADARAQLTFAAKGPADVHVLSSVWQGAAWEVQMETPPGPARFSLKVAGQHNVKNALAATACALAAGVPLSDIERGLCTFEPVKGRSRALSLSLNSHAITLVDDTYNANPDSVRAAIDVLASLPAPRLLVLGDMGEVGNQGPQFHAEVGSYARERGIEHLHGLGEMTRLAVRQLPGAQHFSSVETLNAAALALLPRVGSVLVKGSRFMKMERVVQAIAEHAQNPKETQHV